MIGVPSIFKLIRKVAGTKRREAGVCERQVSDPSIFKLIRKAAGTKRREAGVCERQVSPINI